MLVDFNFEGEKLSLKSPTQIPHLGFPMKKRRRRIKAISGGTHLPEEIIHHIQSFLSGKETARTTILSKSWYKAWLSRPSLDFSDLDVQTPREFVELAKDTIQRYDELSINIQSFRLSMDYYELGNISMAKELIVKALKLGATDLDIQFPLSSRNLLLPPELLESETLVRLSLHNCKIDLQNQKVNCSRLKYLSFSRVFIEADTFWSIISICPLIEELILSHAKGKTLASRSGLGVHFFDKLKKLCLKEVRIGGWFFCDLSSRFPCLKDLALEGCIGHEEISIRSNSLECISFTNINIFCAMFDIPRIRKFKFSGSCLPSLIFKTIPRESDISIMFHSYDLKTSLFPKLREFLLKLSPSKISLNLSVGIISVCDNDIRDNVIGLPEPPIVVEKLALRMHGPCYFPRALLHVLFRCFRPSSVTLYRLPLCCYWRITNNNFTELLCKTLIKKSGKKRSMPVLRDLEEVDVEFFEDHPIKGCRPLPCKTLPDALAYSENIKVKVCLQLRWGGSL